VVRRIALLLAVAPLLGACSPCTISEQEVTGYVADATCAGRIVAPTLGLPDAVPTTCGGAPECGGNEACLMSPNTCEALCLSFLARDAYTPSLSILMQLIMRPSATSIVLPDPRVIVQAEYDPSPGPAPPLTVKGGTLKFVLGANTFTSTYSLQLVDADGVEIDIDDGAFNLRGRTATACLAD
jgi:hypothetical protein